MSMTKDVGKSRFPLKLKLAKLGQSVNGHIALELQKLEATGEVAHAPEITFKEDDGGANYAVQI